MEGYVNKMEDFIQKYWRDLFSQYCFPAKYVKCSQQFYKYLMADGVFIHSNYSRDIESQLVKDDTILFPQIQTAINQALKKYGSIFVKMNWKSAKDCKSWLGGLQCQHIQDVLKTIKCSSYISEILEDYEHLYPQHLYLILKRYQNLDRNLQLRCFVREKQIFVCQRSTEHIFVQLQLKNQYYEKICNFLKEIVIPKLGKQKFSIDLYVPKNSSIKIMDIGPWREFTNSLLFSWQQLQTFPKGQLRVVDNLQQVLYEDLGNYNKPNEQQMKWLVSQITNYQS